MVKERYEFAIRNNEEVIWSKVDGDHITHILIICVLILLSGIILNALPFRVPIMMHWFLLW